MCLDRTPADTLSLDPERVAEAAKRVAELRAGAQDHRDSAAALEAKADAIACTWGLPGGTISSDPRVPSKPPAPKGAGDRG